MFNESDSDKVVAENSFTTGDRPADDRTFYTKRFQENGTLGDVYKNYAAIPLAEGKFLYAYELLKGNGLLPFGRKLPRTGKNDGAARSYRKMANESFKDERYADALRDYRKSLIFSVFDGEDYAFGLANRSAALYHLEEYEACIVDVRRALISKYPGELAYKLYEREVKCLAKLGRISQAESMLNKFLPCLDRTNLSPEKKLDIEVQLKTFLKKSSTEEKLNDDKKITIELLGGPNRCIPSLSKYVKINYSESMGRCLVVTTDIKPGDVVAIEKPYAGVIRDESYHYNCHYCFKLCLSGIPCPDCMVIYCDKNCQVKAFESGHKYECKIFEAFNGWPCMNHMERLTLHIFFTSICKLGLDQFIATVHASNVSTSDPIMKGFNNNGVYLSSQLYSAYALEGNETKRKLAGLEIPDHQLGIVGESLVHILCVVSSNGHEIAQPSKRKTWNLGVEHEYLEVASLLLPVLSLLNHHCDPNVVRHNYDGNIVLRALKPIPKNSQLFDNYGGIYATHEKEKRQELFNKQYLFHCECEACEENWPLYTTMLEQPRSQLKFLTSVSYQMYKNHSKQLYEIILEMKKNRSNGLDHLQFLYSYLSFLHENIKRPWKEYCDCQETIKEILFTTADHFSINSNY